MILKDLRISASVFNEVCFLITQNVREKIEAEPGTGMFESLHDLCVGSIYYYHQPVRLLVNDRKFPAGNSVFLSHQTSQQ